MPRFSGRSLSELETCDERLQKIAHEAIKHFDFMVYQGHRSIEEQQRLYAQGRTKPGPIITKVDGIHRKSKHNHHPARAFDAVPWMPGIGIVWDDRERFCVMGGIFIAVASCLGIDVRWGGNWDDDAYFNERGDDWDLPHLELYHR